MVLGAIAAAVGIGGSVASGIAGARSARRARRKAARAQRKAISLMEARRPMLQRGYSDYLKALTEGEASINQSAQRAKQAFTLQGATASADVREQSAKALGNIKQGLLNAGTFSTSLMQNAERGVMAQTTRELTAVREMVGRLTGGLEERRGASLAGISMARAQGSMERYQAESDINASIASILANTQYTASSGAAGWGQLLAGLAPLIGGLGGMGSGAGAGPSGSYLGKVSYQYTH